MQPDFGLTPRIVYKNPVLSILSLDTGSTITPEYIGDQRYKAYYQLPENTGEEPIVLNFELLANGESIGDEGMTTSVTIYPEEVEIRYRKPISFDTKENQFPFTGGTAEFLINFADDGGEEQVPVYPSPKAHVYSNAGDDYFTIKGLPEAKINGSLSADGGSVQLTFTHTMDENDFVVNCTREDGTPYQLQEGDEIRVTQTVTGKLESPEYLHVVAGAVVEDEDDDSWELTTTIVGQQTLVMVWKELKLADFDGYNGQRICESQWLETDPANLKVRFFSKYVQDDDWNEAHFDAIVGLGTGLNRPNSIHVWGFYDDFVYFSGSHSNGQAPIQIKLVKA